MWRKRLFAKTSVGNFRSYKLDHISNVTFGIFKEGADEHKFSLGL